MLCVGVSLQLAGNLNRGESIAASPKENMQMGTLNQMFSHSSLFPRGSKPDVELWKRVQYLVIFSLNPVGNFGKCSTFMRYFYVVTIMLRFSM